MATPIPPDELARYRAGSRQREQKRRQQQTLRQEAGWRVAREAAQVLKHDFGAKRVWLFGSLLEVRYIYGQSDVDLAVEGLEDSLYLQAVARLLDLSDFSVDLVQLEYARPRLRQTLEEHGVEL